MEIIVFLLENVFLHKEKYYYNIIMERNDVIIYEMNIYYNNP